MEAHHLHSDHTTEPTMAQQPHARADRTRVADIAADAPASPFGQAWTAAVRLDLADLDTLAEHVAIRRIWLARWAA